MTAIVPSFFAAATISSQDGGVCAIAVAETSNGKNNSAKEITAETRRTRRKKYMIKQYSELGELSASAAKMTCRLSTPLATVGFFE
jgi:hypothetical protein